MLFKLMLKADYQFTYKVKDEGRFYIIANSHSLLY
jgi:hypothetical protein